jgi:hypothetical protein
VEELPEGEPEGDAHEARLRGEPRPIELRVVAAGEGEVLLEVADRARDRGGGGARPCLSKKRESASWPMIDPGP